jgi:hypothetical protein
VSRHDGAIARTNNPTIARPVELRLVHASVEANVPTEVEFFVDVMEILADFLPRRIELAVLPISPQVIARKLIHRAGGIDASSRITIPIPDAAGTVPGLKHLDGHAHATQTVQEVESGKSRADYDDVEFFGLGVASPFRLSRAHMVQFLGKFTGKTAPVPGTE